MDRTHKAILSLKQTQEALARAIELLSTPDGDGPSGADQKLQLPEENTAHYVAPGAFQQGIAIGTPTAYAPGSVVASPDMRVLPSDSVEVGDVLEDAENTNVYAVVTDVVPDGTLTVSMAGALMFRMPRSRFWWVNGPPPGLRLGEK